jgi:hypothetical protein
MSGEGSHSAPVRASSAAENALKVRRAIPAAKK